MRSLGILGYLYTAHTQPLNMRCYCQNNVLLDRCKLSSRWNSKSTHAIQQESVTLTTHAVRHGGFYINVLVSFSIFQSITRCRYHLMRFVCSVMARSTFFSYHCTIQNDTRYQYVILCDRCMLWWLDPLLFLAIVSFKMLTAISKCFMWSMYVMLARSRGVNSHRQAESSIN